MSNSSVTGNGERKDLEEAESAKEDNSVTVTTELRLVLIGRTGSGKSASGNTILGECHFLSQLSASSVTQVCEQAVVDLPAWNEDDDGSNRVKRVAVVDMPGFGDTRFSTAQIHTEIAKCVALTSPGPHAFLLVVPLGRYTEDEGRAAREMVQVFGEGALSRHTVVLFTRGDDLEGHGLDGYVGETAPEELKSLLEKCRGRYHVLNNRDPGNRDQVRELLKKVEQMVEENNGEHYTNTIFLQAEKVIQEEQERLMREGGHAEGEEEREEREREAGSRGGMEECKRRRRDLEERWWNEGGAEGSSGLRRRALEMRQDPPSAATTEIWREEKTDDAWGLLQARGQKWREQWRNRRRGSGTRALGRRQSLRSALERFRREAALSGKVLERVKIMVAAGATGMAVGAVFGAAAPLAMAAGATVMGNTVGLAAGQLAGASMAGGAGMGKALGAIVAAATGKTAVALGAATGGVLGGSVGALVGAEANSPGEGALDTLGQVGVMGAAAVGVAAGVGGAVGAGAVLGTALEGTAAGAAALTGTATAAGAASVANAAAVAAPQTVATGGGIAGALQTAGGAVAEGVVTANPGLMGALGTMGATARIMTAVADIGKAAAGIALAGGLVVKVVKEKVRTHTSSSEDSYSERKTYEIYWNK